jgi:hypothetical protein
MSIVKALAIDHGAERICASCVAISLRLMRLCLFISFQFFGTSNVSHQLVALRIHVVYMIEGLNEFWKCL